MKKLFTLIIVATAMILMSSCTKLGFSLVGSKWQYVEDGITTTITFSTKTECSITPDGLPLSINATYTYSRPNVTIYPPAETEADPIHGTVSGDIMTLNADGETVILNRVK